MIAVQEGDWVELGQELGRFLQVGSGAHIHFDVIEDNNRQCFTKYFSAEAYTEITSLIHYYHPDWNLCYVE